MSMISRIYLFIVSALYFALAIWCSMAPTVTSQKVGFSLQPGTGQSEFLTVYGGLEFGMALTFLISLIRKNTIAYGVIACVLLHGSLVVFRTISFFSFANISPFIYRLAIGEWVIAILGVAVLFVAKRKPRS